jgi:hypothetical protein
MQQLTFDLITKKIIGRIIAYNSPCLKKYPETPDHLNTNVQGVIKHVVNYRLNAKLIVLEDATEAAISTFNDDVFELLLYPKLPVNYSQFCEQLGDRCTVDEDSNVMLFKTYRTAQARLRPEWVRKNGFESVAQWVQFFFTENKKS